MPRGVYERKEKSAVNAAQGLNAADAPEKNAASPKEEKDIATMALLAIRGYVMAMRMSVSEPSISDMLRIEAIVDKGLGDGEDD